MDLNLGETRTKTVHNKEEAKAGAIKPSSEDQVLVFEKDGNDPQKLRLIARPKQVKQKQKVKKKFYQKPLFKYVALPILLPIIAFLGYNPESDIDQYLDSKAFTQQDIAKSAEAYNKSPGIFRRVPKDFNKKVQEYRFKNQISSGENKFNIVEFVVDPKADKTNAMNHSIFRQGSYDTKTSDVFGYVVDGEHGYQEAVQHVANNCKKGSVIVLMRRAHGSLNRYTSRLNWGPNGSVESHVWDLNDLPDMLKMIPQLKQMHDRTWDKNKDPDPPMVNIYWLTGACYPSHSPQDGISLIEAEAIQAQKALESFDYPNITINILSLNKASGDFQLPTLYESNLIAGNISSSLSNIKCGTNAELEYYRSFTAAKLKESIPVAELKKGKISYLPEAIKTVANSNMNEFKQGQVSGPGMDLIKVQKKNGQVENYFEKNILAKVTKVIKDIDPLNRMLINLDKLCAAYSSSYLNQKEKKCLKDGIKKHLDFLANHHSNKLKLLAHIPNELYTKSSYQNLMLDLVKQVLKVKKKLYKYPNCDGFYDNKLKRLEEQIMDIQKADLITPEIARGLYNIFSISYKTNMDRALDATPIQQPDNTKTTSAIKSIGKQLQRLCYRSSNLKNNDLEEYFIKYAVDDLETWTNKLCIYDFIYWSKQTNSANSNYIKELSFKAATKLSHRQGLFSDKLSQIIMDGAKATSVKAEQLLESSLKSLSEYDYYQDDKNLNQDRFKNDRKSLDDAKYAIKALVKNLDFVSKHWNQSTEYKALVEKSIELINKFDEGMIKVLISKHWSNEYVENALLSTYLSSRFDLKFFNEAKILNNNSLKQKWQGTINNIEAMLDIRQQLR